MQVGQAFEHSLAQEAILWKTKRWTQLTGPCCFSQRQYVKTAARALLRGLFKGGISMKTFEDHKDALKNAGPRLSELLLAQAENDGFTAWQTAELAGVRAEMWA